jgi:hypothetical protein
MVAVGRLSMMDMGETEYRLILLISSSAGEVGALTLCEGTFRVEIGVTAREVAADPVALVGRDMRELTLEWLSTAKVVEAGETWESSLNGSKLPSSAVLEDMEAIDD